MLNASGNSGGHSVYFQFSKAWETAGLRVKDISRSLCYPVLCGHCLPSCQAEREAPGLLVGSFIALAIFGNLRLRISMIKR